MFARKIRKNIKKNCRFAIYVKLCYNKKYFDLLKYNFISKKIFFKGGQFMRAVEMKIAIPEVEGGRCILTEIEDGYILLTFAVEESEKSSISSELECRIDPNIFAGEWLEHQPTTKAQKEMLDLYQDAKAKGRLHAFTCMTVEPSFDYYIGKLRYEKGLKVNTGYSAKQWESWLRHYDPIRNSRMMTRTEYVCRNLFLIQKLVVESGYEIAKAWEEVCDNSQNLGNFHKKEGKDDFRFEPSGSREICGFCDLGNHEKILAEDPWERTISGFWKASGCQSADTIASMDHCCFKNMDDLLAVGMLAMD